MEANTKSRGQRRAKYIPKGASCVPHVMSSEREISVYVKLMGGWVANSMLGMHFPPILRSGAPSDNWGKYILLVIF